MTIPSYDTNLGHLALAISDTYLLIENGNTAFIQPVNLGVPLPPLPSPPRVATRTHMGDPLELTKPFLVQEAIRKLQEDQDRHQNGAKKTQHSVHRRKIY